MPATWLRFPVWRDTFANEDALEWFLPVEVRTSTGIFGSLGFLIDSASQLTTIPIWIARKNTVSPLIAIGR